MSLKFVPPKEDAKNLPRYGSYVVGNGLKVHGRLVDAKNSWRNRGWTRGPNPDWKEGDYWGSKYKSVTREAFILENVDGIWYTLYHINQGLTETELPWYKQFIVGQWTNHEYSDYYKTNDYYQKRLEAGEYKLIMKPVPMTRDEYVDWRLAVQKEQLAEKFGVKFE